jgi:CRISPR system Cascade subunit CasC
MPHDTLFLQFHTLTPFAASLLNRDDVGRAKRMPYGGASRIRVSSQCLKRHWREAAGDWSLDGLLDPARETAAPGTVRSRKILSRLVGQPLVEEDGFAVDDVIAVVDALKAAMLGESKKAKADKAAKKPKAGAAPAGEAAGQPLDEHLEVLDTNQVIVLGRPEIDFIRQSAAALLRQRPNDWDVAIKAYLKENKPNLEAMRLASGLDAAMFGRMVTSDILARGDGAIHVAHALTVHAEEAEPDYFVAIDELTREAGELGTGLIQTAELTSGLFYGNVVIDVPLLVSNLEGVPAKDWRSADRRLAASVVEHLVHVIATTSPGAKRGSTAPYGYADLVLAEAGSRQPRSLMTAFHHAVPKEDARSKAVAALAAHMHSFDGMYGRHERRRVAALLDSAALPAEPSADGLAGLAGWAAAQVLADAG